MIRNRLPNTAVAFVSMKPSPSRVAFRQTVIAGNQKIREFLAKQTNTAYIDVYPKMLNRDGFPIGALFLSDSLHMTQKGYDVWQAAILPYLKK
jgi:lysophospholipase L1-like esterase